MLLKKAEINIKLAMYASSTGDAFTNDLAIFHCQQALERIMKYILVNYGGMADNDHLNRLHDITILIKLVEKKTVILIPTAMKELADNLTEWRITSRYGDEHVGSAITSAILIHCYDEIKNELINHYSPR